MTQSIQANRIISQFRDLDLATDRIFNVKSAAYGAVGDGTTDDAPAIQAAIDAAESVGGRVLIPQGTYLLNAGILIDSPYVTLEGLGKPILRASAIFDSELLDPESGVVFVKDTYHISIKGLQIEAGDAIASSGIMVRRSDHVLVSFNRIDGTVSVGTQSGAGIGVYGDCYHVRVEHNTILNVAYSGLNVAREDSDPADFNPPVGTVFFANHVENSARDGVDIYQTVDTKVIANRIVGSGRYGINPTGGTAEWPNRHVHIEGNTVIDGALTGIYLHQHAYRCRIIGNYCENNTHQGIGVDDATNIEAIVEGNHCYDNAKNGITVGSLRCVVVGNHCRGNGADNTHSGINVFGNGDKSIIANNHCYANTGSGILLNGVDQCIVEGNYAEANTQYGIEVLTALGNVVRGNYVLENAEHGIYLNNADRNSIDGNYCSGNGTSTGNTYSNILLDSDSDDNKIQGNRCYKGDGANKSYAGIRIEADTCDNNWIAENDVKDGGNIIGISDQGTGTMITPENREITHAVSGPWTPAVTGSASAPTVGYGYRAGGWVRQGPFVFITFEFQITSISGGSGEARVTGLPFDAADVTTPLILVNKAVFGSRDVEGYVFSGNGGYLRFFSIAANGTLSDFNVTSLTTGYISGTAVYRVASS
jgi:parallel beta-helix repeat protein